MKIKIFVGALAFAVMSAAYMEYVQKEDIETAKKIENTSVEQVGSASMTLLESDGIVIPPQVDLPKKEVYDGYSTDYLIRLQQKIEAIEDDISTTKGELVVMQKEIQSYEDGIEKKKIEQAEKTELAGYYIVPYYMARRDANLQLLFLDSEDYRDFLYRYSTTKEIMHRANRSVKQSKLDAEEMEENKSFLSRRSDLYQSALGSLEEKEKELQTERDRLTAFLTSHQEDLQIEDYEAIMKLGGYISASKHAYSISQTGKFMRLPVSGEVTSPYGSRVHPIYGETRHHAGVDIGVDYNTPVQAAADGIVIMSAWYGGYGKVVMINHGNNIVSLYGHNNKLLVSEGDVVHQGQVVALAGSTGNSTGPHCHFEVRLDGDDINPYTYIR